MHKLRSAIELAAKAHQIYADACLQVWREFTLADQQLAEDILRLCSNEEAASFWVCYCVNGPEESPAELLASGRGHEIAGHVLRTLHGFVG